MSEVTPADKEFLGEATRIIEQNIANERFGVEELADAMNMSRSNLLRKIKRATSLSVNQMIREIRLRRGMELLRTSSSNVSEVSDQVGFNSTSYFIKCFREYYGYPPGEVGKRSMEVTAETTEDPPVNRDALVISDNKRSLYVTFSVVLVVLLLAIAGYLFYDHHHTIQRTGLEKSLAVLPFINDSNDSTNVYLINGLMESTLMNLQKIKDLKVISRTSAEKYRNTSKSIPEMARELNVSYFIEGSGQKIGNQILLNIQLIEGSSDRHLWSRQYKREATDIFALQQEIAKDIAQEIRAVITPSEKEQIDKIPTESLEAYDLFMKGVDAFKKGGNSNLETAIGYFKEAIRHDEKFALAHAEIAMAYYYLDAFMAEKKYDSEIDAYSDKAMLLDPQSPQTLLARAVFYIQRREYPAAVPYLEKALEYNPNASQVISFLSDMYNYFIPDTGKYLEYALRGVRLDAGAQDSLTASTNYLRLANALVQAGFIEESLNYVNQSLALNPGNFYSTWVKAFVLFAKTKDAQQTKRLLLEQLDKDTTNLLMAEEIGKVCYMMGDYQEAYKYYKKFIDLRKEQKLNIFDHESLRIAFVLKKVGKPEQAAEFVTIYKKFCDEDKSTYKAITLGGYYAYLGDGKKVVELMNEFSKQNNFQYWVLLMRVDPMIQPVMKEPGFEEAMNAIEKKYWENHRQLRNTLEEKGVL